jgi:hypothetical protein
MIKQLRYHEQMQRAYKKIGSTIKPPKNLGLNRIDIPDPSARHPDLGNPDNPKTWKGPWLSISNPERIAKEVTKVNIAQYHQAHNTPFGSGTLAEKVGRSADTPIARDILQGIIPDIPTLLPETKRILHLLGSSILSPISTPPSPITEDKFKPAYKVIPENSSSSLSGRHVGHYKAILPCSSLVQMHCTMMTIPFLSGIPPARWQRVVDIMLHKEEGNFRCHRLRIIALFESDLNQAKRIIIGRKLSHHLEDTNVIGEMQYGSRPGKQCQSAVLHKVLLHDISHLTKIPAAFIENDAIGCYNRLVNGIVLLLLQKFGFPSSVIACLSNLWDSTLHFIKTMYGTSDISYSSTSSCPLYGPGQGSTCGPVFWLLCYLAIVQSIDPSMEKATMISVCKTITATSRGASFVDDSGLAVTSVQRSLPRIYDKDAETQSLLSNLQAASQHWER